MDSMVFHPFGQVSKFGRRVMLPTAISLGFGGKVSDD